MSELTIVLDAAGAYVDASPSALALLGVTLDELRALPPGSLSDAPLDDEQVAALRSVFRESGAGRAVGSATIRRPDGQRVRVRFLLDEQPDGRYLARLAPAGEGLEQPTVVLTIGQVLAAWRAAERRLAELDPQSAEWMSVQGEVDVMRTQYRRLADGGRPKN